MTDTAAATRTRDDLRDLALHLADAWTALWNGDLERADTILAPDFRIEFGAELTDPDPRAIRSPADMADFVAAWRARHGDLRFAIQHDPVVDETLASVAFTWSVERPDGVRRSGIDLCRIVDDRIARVWSVTGERLFA